MTRGAAVALLGLLVAAGSARAASVTVANGADLSNAVSSAAPGDVITLLDGTYFVSAPLDARAAGSAAAPIKVVTAHGPHAATIVAQGAAEEPVKISGAWWLFDGVDFSGGRFGVRLVGGGSDAVVRNATFIDNAVAGLRADCGGPDASPHCDRGRLEAVSVRRSAVPNECSFSGVELVGAEDWTIHALAVRDLAGDDFACGSNLALTAVAVRGNSKRLTLDTVVVRGGLLGLALGPSSQNPCEVRGAVDPGNGLCTIPTPCALQTSLVSNGVVWLAAREAIQLSNACDVRIHNVTLWNNGGATPRSIEILGSGTVDLSNVILNTVVINSSATPVTGGGNLTLPSSADLTWFLDAANGNFRLLAEVPPIDTGLTLADVPLDYDGLTRPQGLAYDVGAFERPPGGYPDGGVPGDGGVGDGGAGDGGGSSVPPPGTGGGGFGPPRGCSCELGAATGGSGVCALAVALCLALALRRRRRL
jgi:hypothetical protein